MAEHLKLDFPVLNPEAENTEHIVPKDGIATFEEGIFEKPDGYIPKQYTIDKYYTDDKLGADVLKNKYLTPDENHPWELWQRVAKATASVEKTAQSKEHWEAQFFSILENFKFVPGGRIMHGAGRDGIKTTLNNCYVVAIDSDSINSIYKTVHNEALTYKIGGGCGHDLSVLRPSGAEIGGTGGGLDSVAEGRWPDRG